MAIFLSRIKRALNVGSKSITNNGTYYASADGYDGYDEVTVNVSGGSATPITPSNANPVALSSGVAVEPTANGYAIQSYDSVTPSSTPASVASGDIVKIGGSGVIVDSVPSPTSVTPSDSTPPQLTQGNSYEPTANGYLYASSGLGKVASGSFTSPATAGTTIEIACGFQPKKICLVMYTSTTSMYSTIYDDDMDSSRQIAGWRTSSSSSGCQQYSLPNSSNNGVISEITSNSFVCRGGTTTAGKTVYYFALG